jgi:hypothetical protein
MAKAAEQAQHKTTNTYGCAMRTQVLRLRGGAGGPAPHSQVSADARCLCVLFFSLCRCTLTLCVWWPLASLWRRCWRHQALTTTWHQVWSSAVELTSQTQHRCGCIPGCIGWGQAASACLLVTRTSAAVLIQCLCDVLIPYMLMMSQPQQ